MRINHKKTTLIPIADGTEEIEAITIADTLRRAGIKVTLASVTKLEITATRNIKILADKIIADCQNNDYDLIAIPGGLPGAEYIRDCETTTNLLKKQARLGKLYAGICAAPVVVLQHHGLLKNRVATCHPALFEQLQGEKSHNKVVVDQNCITSQGPGTSLLFSIRLVELLTNKQVAKTVADEMLVDIDI